MVLGFSRSDIRLTWNFFRMNLRDRYLGSRLGSVWAIANPVVMLSIFTFMFGYVFKAKLPGADTTLAYVAWLISGYGPWLAISESTTSAAQSVVGSASIVKNMAIKTEVLPVAAAMLGIVPLAVSFLFLIGVLVADGNAPTWHVMFVPLVVFLQFCLVVALAFYTAPLTVFMRDFGVLLPNLLLVLLFLTPIFYTLESVPRVIQLISLANPFYILSEAYRDALVYHRVPNILGLAYVGLLSFLVGLAGLRAFRRVKGYFSGLL